MKVSVIIPCRNERAHIAECLQSILANDYSDKELIVVDGMSHDGTREELNRFPVRVIDNPRRITPCALNLGIEAATGEVILWMSAHSRYPVNYISQCVEHLEAHDADNVGGVIVTVPRKDSIIGRSIAAALSHPFGVGNSAFRTHLGDPIWVDTVFGGCYRRDVFARIGRFNENLARGQDLEFNLRLRRAGGKTLLIPSIITQYYARSGFLAFCVHNVLNGIWAILPFLYSRIIPISARHLVPLLFVLSLIISAFIEPRVSLGIAAAYVLCALAASIHVVTKRREFVYLLTMPLMFGSLHVMYGMGSLVGVMIAPIYRLFRPKA